MPYGFCTGTVAPDAVGASGAYRDPARTEGGDFLPLAASVEAWLTRPRGEAAASPAAGCAREAFL
jgi:hypothetical protein